MHEGAFSFIYLSENEWNARCARIGVWRCMNSYISRPITHQCLQQSLKSMTEICSERSAQKVVLLTPYLHFHESEFDRSKQKGLKFQHVCNQDYGDWKWSQGLNKTMGVMTYLSTLGSTLKIIWSESVGRIVSGLIDIDPCSKTAKIHQGDLIGRWVWEGKCNVFNCICVYNIAWQCEIFTYIYIYITLNKLASV